MPKYHLYHFEWGEEALGWKIQRSQRAGFEHSQEILVLQLRRVTTLCFADFQQ